MEGLVLRRIDYGESDQVIKIFLREKGTVSAIAKGIKRSKKRFPHHLEPFRIYEFKLARKKEGRDLYLIQTADQRHDYEGIQEDIRKIALGNFLLEIVLIAVREEHPHPELYAFMKDFFRALSRSDAIYPLWFYAMIHVMGLLGFSPNLQTCLKCGTPLRKGETNHFDPAGGVVCPTCASQGIAHGLIPLNSETLSALNFLKKSPLQAAPRLQMTEGTRACIETSLLSFIAYHLGRSLKTLAFLKEVLTPPQSS